MKCPYCQSKRTICKDTRAKEDYARYRRYECLDCNRRFSTTEIPVDKERRTAEAERAIEDMEAIANGAEPCVFCDTHADCPHPASCPDNHYKNFRWKDWRKDKC